MSLSTNPEIREKQSRAINMALELAPKIQRELREKFMMDESSSGYNDLLEYRLRNTYLEISQDLFLSEQYEISENISWTATRFAFTGYDGEFSLKKLKGLFDDKTNTLIRELHWKKVGKRSSSITQEKGTGLFGMTPEERTNAGRRGGTISGKNGYENRTGIHGRTPEKMSEDGRKGYEAAGWDKKTSEELSERAKEVLNKINPDTGEKYAVEWGRARGLKSKELGLGIFARSEEQKTLDGRLGARAVHANQGHKLWYDEYGTPSELLEDLIDLTENPENRNKSGSRINWNSVYDQMVEKHPKRDFNIPSLRPVICTYNKQLKNQAKSIL